MKTWRMLLLVVGLAVAGCSSDAVDESLATVGDADAEVAGENATATTTTTTTTTPPPRAATIGSACTSGDMPLMESLTVSADGGLNARQTPGDGTIITRLANGSAVTTSDDPLACGVLDDGSVWFQITASTLSGSGWVHSGFLQAEAAPAPEADSGATDEAAILAAAPVVTADERPPEFGRRCSNPQLPRASELTVVNPGGVNRRAWPRNGTVIELLEPGTVVSVTVIVNQCAVLDDGSIWYEIGRGGWVHSGFLG